MIKNIIFDFGDIYINLDKVAPLRVMNQKFGDFQFTPEMLHVNDIYEKGLMTSDEFMSFYMNIFPEGKQEDFLEVWNAIFLDFPDYRIDFLEQLAATKKYNIYLLSNTNDLHIQYVIKTESAEKFERFRSCFNHFYLSYEMGLRKPEPEIFQKVLTDNHLKPEETLFIDDTLEHIESARNLGIQTWHLIVGKQDVTELFDQPFQLS